MLKQILIVLYPIGSYRQQRGLQAKLQGRISWKDLHASLPLHYDSLINAQEREFQQANLSFPSSQSCQP